MVAGNQVGQQLTICSKRFGGVEIDSGIALASLPKKTADAVRKRAYAGAMCFCSTSE